MPHFSSGVTFQESWLQDISFSPWLERSSSSKHEAYCSICRKTFDFKSMGRSALVSHMKGKKHSSLVDAQETAKKGGMLSFVKSSKSTNQSPAPLQSAPSSSLSVPSQSSIPTSSTLASRPMEDFVSDSAVLQSEIWWCIRTAMHNHSTTSNGDIEFYLKQMFPNIPIVKKFSCASTKSSYMMSFGIVPFLRSILVDQVSDQPFSLMFDESLNKSLAQKQLDIHLRYWCSGTVQSRYFNSKMLGHSTSNDLLDALNSCQESIDFKNLVHLSMDGPNVNWATFDKLERQLKTDYDHSLLNIGSCGLHQLHNALRKGMGDTGWDLLHFLSSAYTLFKDVPARRDDYTSVTGSSSFPKKYCGHRWVENQQVMARLKEILPNLKTYIKAVREKKIPDPATKSFAVVKTFTEDPLAEIKLAFAISLCKPMEKFLTRYQADRPLVPFLYNDLNNLMISLTKRVASIDSVKNIVDFDFTKDKDKLLEYSKVAIGTEASELLKKSKVTPRMILDFRMKCKEAIVAIVTKLLNKSPLTYSLCRYLQFLDPEIMITKSKRASQHLKSALLLTSHCPLDQVDDIMEEYSTLINASKSLSGFVNFDSDRDRVDELFFNTVENNKKYSQLWPFIKKCLVISHGQASVERGFSENKMALDTNMSERTLIARRTIKDHIRSIGGIEKFKINDKLIKSCSLAYRKYKAYLEENEEEKKSSKRKAAEEEVVALKKRRVELIENASHLRKESNKTYDQAEKAKCMKDQLTLYTSANALRKTADQKDDDASSLSKELEEKEALFRMM